MSGSSLDGLDLTICRFTLDDGPVVADWSIVAAETDPFPPPWLARLEMAPHLPGRELWRLHTDLGRWIGQRLQAFLRRHPESPPELIGSHGHTVFHEPGRGFTTQIGDGAAIAAVLQLPTVTELRSTDVAMGGQGAPLAPVGDKYLFPEYTAFLNLGGIANLSVKRGDAFVAGDISGCCQILDRLAALEGLEYDADGALSRRGSFRPELAERIGALPFHALPYPKSLANDWVRDELWPLLRTSAHPPADRLHTFTKWLAAKVTADLAGEQASGRVLVTGGGANNGFLLEQLSLAGPDLDFVVPDPRIADFKEAAFIALCALLRREGYANSLASATGAPRDTVNGALYLPPS